MIGSTSVGCVTRYTPIKPSKAGTYRVGNKLPTPRGHK